MIGAEPRAPARPFVLLVPDLQKGLYHHKRAISAIILTYLSGVILGTFVTFRTSLHHAHDALMDKVDYEARLAAEVKKLAEFQEALRQEHAKVESEANDGKPALVASVVYAAAEQKLLGAVSDAADAIVDIVNNADKDATRLAAAKTIMALAKQTPGSESDPWDAILAKISADTVDESPTDAG
jgi:hypothetical protein